MTTPIPILIVDDEAPSRRALRELLAEELQVQVVAEAANVTDAAHLAGEKRPQVIFLDITMPVRSGFELLPLLSGGARVVFVTAFDEYAVRAFEYHAIDYLLKPIRRERLALTLSRIIRTCRDGQLVSKKATTLSEELALSTTRGVRVVRFDEITHIVAEGNYSKIHLADRTSVLVRRSMTGWEQFLPVDRFFRPHRSMIFNLAAVRDVKAINRNVTEVRVVGRDQKVPIGRRASILIRRMLRFSLQPEMANRSSI